MKTLDSWAIQDSYLSLILDSSKTAHWPLRAAGALTGYTWFLLWLWKSEVLREEDDPKML